MRRSILVSKRDGRQEPLDLEKIHRVVAWAARNLKNISVSLVEMKAQLQFYPGIQTAVIHEMLIKSAADLISEEWPDYQYLAARLSIFHLRKQAYGVFTPPSLYNHVKRLVACGKYEPKLLEWYTPAEFEIMESYLDHWRDMQFSYAAVKQLEGKYLVRDRATQRLYESPQFLYILIAATLFSGYPVTSRLTYIKRFYEAISQFKISLPTPIMAGVRTPTRQFSSCVLLECGDSLDSINAVTATIVNYISQRAGIGINAGRIRAIGSSIRGGEALHTGCIPFYKLFQSAVKSCSQGGVRGGAATLFYPIWHLEVESLLVLKNNRGVEENRVRHLDYAVQINGFFYKRLLKDQAITLFSPSDVPDLYESFFSDQSLFESLYIQYEADASIRKKQVSALELFSLIVQERASTGRLYIQHVDHCNTHSPFQASCAPVRQSNLCMEITLPTAPLSLMEPDKGEIALCTLSAINLGCIETLSELEQLADLTVRALDALLDYQAYLHPAARRSGQKRRSLGIGVINFAYFLARHGYKYSDERAKALTHQLFERFQYELLKASHALAVEKGPAPLFGETNYAKGLLPIDHYKASVDELCDQPLLCDWECLRAAIKKDGLRHSTLTALMPSETSSQIANATNGIEPARGYVSVKASKDGILRQVVPEYQRLKSQYDLLWEQQDNLGYLQLVAIMQKFIDQSISANTHYDPSTFSGLKVPVKQLLRDLLTSYRWGIKTLYYHHTRDEYGLDSSYQSEVHLSQAGCDGGACAI